MNPPAGPRPRVETVANPPGPLPIDQRETKRESARPGSNIAPLVGNTLPNQPSPRASGRLRSPQDVAAHRAALGLSSMKPSEMVAGLEKAAERAGKIEERAEARRKAGGKMNANVALHVDSTGRRWAWKLRGALVAIAVLALIAVALMVYISNRNVIPAREGNEQARQALKDLEVIGTHMKLFDEDENVTAETAKARLLEKIDQDLAIAKEQRDLEKKQNRPPSNEIIRTCAWLASLREFKDPWDQPFIFKMANPDTLEITAVGKLGSSDFSAKALTATLNIRAPKKKR